MPWPARIWAAVLVAATTACSTKPYVQQAASFGTATLDVVQAYADMVQGERQDRQRLDQARVEVGGFAFIASTGCTNLSRLVRQGCAYEALASAAASSARARRGAFPVTLASLPRPADDPAAAAAAAAKAAALPEPPAACMTNNKSARLASVRPEAIFAGPTQAPGAPSLDEDELFGLLSKYADALKAIVDTSDRAAFDAASDKLATEAGTLATTVGALAGGVGAAAGPVVTAGVKLGAFATAQAYDAARYRALQEAFRQSCIPLRILGIAAGALIDGHRTIRFGTNEQTLDLTSPQNAPRGVDRTALFAIGQQAVASQDSLRKDPMAVARAMVDAHDKLAAAVIEGRGQSTEVLAAVQTFVDLAKGLRTALATPSKP